MVLNCPPEEWPNSGENWFCSTENSATASLGTVTRVPVTLVSLLSTPSIVKLLFSRTLAADRRPASQRRRRRVFRAAEPVLTGIRPLLGDRKSTRHSSHTVISYAVFCLK